MGEKIEICLILIKILTIFFYKMGQVQDKVFWTQHEI